MQSACLSRMAVALLFVCGSGWASLADTSDVKGPAAIVIGKSGKHCKDDPHCFNRYHPNIKPAATVQQDQLFVLETRDALDSDLTFASTAQDLAAVNLNLVHPLTGPVYFEGAKRGDALAVTIVDIAPDDFGYTTIVPGFGFLRDVFHDPYIVHWSLTRNEARSKDLPGISVPMNAFMGTVGVLPGKPELDKWLKREKALADAGGAALTPQPVDALPADLCGSNGPAKDECVRTVPPRENGGNLDTKETVVGTTLLFPCFIDGCGLSVGDVHWAQGDGEVSGTAIEMNAIVTVKVSVRKGQAAAFGNWPRFESSRAGVLRDLDPDHFVATMGIPVKPAGVVMAPELWIDVNSNHLLRPLRNESEDVTLASRDALLKMIALLTGPTSPSPHRLTAEQAYLLCSVACDLHISNLVDVPNYVVSNFLQLDVFEHGDDDD